MLEYLFLGGVLMIPLLILSVLMIGVFIDRFICYNQTKNQLKRFLSHYNELIEVDNKSAALKFAATWKSPLSGLFKDIVIHSNMSKDVIQSMLQQKQNSYFSFLNKRTGLLNIITYVSPLIGLLGTIQGMIVCFRNLESSHAIGTERITTLSGGIWQALITTAAGLIISIISFFLSNYILYLINNIIQQTESAGIQTINKIKRNSKVKVQNAV
ncbi:MAG: MotA/TolQ/ExbB proton channel family protein [Planctomycetes bacterium]|nr:MotA/TolQ/ExbB proton channel family protein [Planctomycetota bacterium]